MLSLVGYVRKNLGRQRLRTILSAVGVMLGIWLVVIFSALSAGIERMAESMLIQFGEDFHCYRKGAFDPFVSVLPERDTREKLLSVPGVSETASVVYWAAKGDDTTGIFLIGLRREEFAYRSLMRRGTGGFRDDLDVEQAVVGEGRLEQMGLRLGPDGEVEEGQEIKLGEDVLRVVGCFGTGAPIYDNAVVVPMETMNRLRGGTDVANLVAVRVDSGASAKEVAREVEERFPEFATVRNLSELSKVDQSLDRMKTLSTVISVTAASLGLLFILLAMVMSVFERTREIGILRAVGWRKRRIVQVVLVEALFISILGVVAGIPTGYLGVEIISSTTDLSDFIQPSYETDLFLRALAVALIAACVGGIYPAWRAARLHPMEALRHE